MKNFVAGSKLESGLSKFGLGLVRGDYRLKTDTHLALLSLIRKSRKRNVRRRKKNGARYLVPCYRVLEHDLGDGKYLQLTIRMWFNRKHEDEAFFRPWTESNRPEVTVCIREKNTHQLVCRTMTIRADGSCGSPKNPLVKSIDRFLRARNIPVNLKTDKEHYAECGIAI